MQLTTQAKDFPALPAAIQHLSAGEEAQVAQGRIQKRPHPDVANAIAWRQGQVYFDNAPLEDIVREFNRHGSTVKITLEDVEPDVYRFGGTFNVEEPASLTDILREQHDLIVEQRGRGIVIGVRKKP